MTIYMVVSLMIFAVVCAVASFYFCFCDLHDYTKPYEHDRIRVSSSLCFCYEIPFDELGNDLFLVNLELLDVK